MCINNNAVINNNYGKLQVLISLFKINLATRKGFLEINRQFGYAPSKCFASPVLTTSARFELDISKQ